MAITAYSYKLALYTILALMLTSIGIITAHGIWMEKLKAAVNIRTGNDDLRICCAKSILCPTCYHHNINNTNYCPYQCHPQVRIENEHNKIKVVMPMYCLPDNTSSKLAIAILVWNDGTIPLKINGISINSANLEIISYEACYKNYYTCCLEYMKCSCHYMTPCCKLHKYIACGNSPLELDAGDYGLLLATIDFKKLNSSDGQAVIEVEIQNTVFNNQ